MPHVVETEFDRDSLARWYAKRHLEIDPGVERIFYLPTNAPAREIRFLEVNSLIAEMKPLEPIDFGVDIDGADPHTLNVLDVTPSQWEEIQTNPSLLPPGWTLDDKQDLG